VIDPKPLSVGGQPIDLVALAKKQLADKRGVKSRLAV
jgi:hypothetical protein